tara:strand:+ start:1154 stop:1693 length:540 start_codon:yes stop_codon:yes gene_type:complete
MTNFPVGSLAYVAHVPPGFVFPVKDWRTPSVKKGDVFKVSSRTKNGWIRCYKVNGEEDIGVGRVRFRVGSWLKTTEEMEQHIDSMGGPASKVDQLIRTVQLEKAETTVSNFEEMCANQEKELSKCYERLVVWGEVLQKYSGFTLDEIYDPRCDQACLETEIDYHIKMKIAEANGAGVGK